MPIDTTWCLSIHIYVSYIYRGSILVSVARREAKAWEDAEDPIFDTTTPRGCPSIYIYVACIEREHMYICIASREAEAWEEAEDPIFVLENNVPIHTTWCLSI